MTSAAATSICSVVVVSLVSKVVTFCALCCVVSVVVWLPSRCRSIRFLGMGSMNGGWFLEVGLGYLRLALWGWMSPIWGSYIARVL